MISMLGQTLTRANVVRLTEHSADEQQLDRSRVVVDVHPLAHLHAVAVDRNRFFLPSSW